MFRRKSAPLLTYLSQKTEFEGILHAEGMLRVDGIVHGTVDIQGDLEISSTGLVEGPEVQAHNIVVHGVLKARVVAKGKLTLSRTARLEGDVIAGSLETAATRFARTLRDDRSADLQALGSLTNQASRLIMTMPVNHCGAIVHKCQKLGMPSTKTDISQATKIKIRPAIKVILCKRETFPSFHR